MTYLIQMYSSCGCVSEARQLFDGVALSGNFQRMHIGDERNGFSRNERVPCACMNLVMTDVSF